MSTPPAAATPTATAAFAVATARTSTNSYNPSRRPPSKLNSEQRHAVRRQKRHNPHMTQAQLAEWAAQEFQLSHVPSQSMISVVLSKVKYSRRIHPQDAEAALLKFENKMRRWIQSRSHISIHATRRKAKAYSRRYLVGILRPSQMTREWTIAYLISHRAITKGQLEAAMLD